MPETSIIIPTFNRREQLINNVLKIKTAFPEAEIIIINDGSSDQTDEAVRHHFGQSLIYLKNEKNQGKGFSLRKGFQRASGQYLIFTDDDLPYGLQGIEAVLKELKANKPVVIGERQLFFDNFIKKLGRVFFNRIFKSLLDIKLKDTQAGLKGFSQEAGKKLFQYSFINRFAIDVEIIALCQKFKYPISIVPVHQIDDKPTSLSLLNLFYIFIDTLRIKFHHYE
jgi:dolichyl-phosphate beta-glucosyltransferase